MTDGNATDVMREYGHAFRMDWSGIDGRGVKIDLETLADHVVSKPMSDAEIRSLRLTVGLCPKGDGCWIGEGYECQECDDDECRGL